MEKFVKQNLITLERDPYDARFKKLSISSAGRHFLNEMVQFDNNIAKIGLHPLNEEERNWVGMLFGIISDGLGAPKETSLPGEDYFVTEQKRVARVMGMIGNNYLETGLDLATYQLCFSIFRSSAPVLFRDIKTELPFDPCFLSRESDRLVRSGWCIKRRRISGQGSVALSFTDKGRATFEGLHKNCAVLLEKAFGYGNSKQAADLAWLLARPASTGLVIPLEEKIRVKTAKTEKDYFKARQLAVEGMISRNAHNRLPASFIPESREVLFFSAGNETAGLAVIEKKGPERELELFECSEKAWTRESVIKSMLRHISATADPASLKVGENAAWARDLLQHAKGDIK